MFGKVGLLVIFFVGLFCLGDGRVGFEGFFPSLPVAIEQNESVLCEVESGRYEGFLRNFSLWANEMLDSSAHTPDGILRGNTINFGNFRQCIQAKAPFPTQYCLVAITADIPHTKMERDPFSNRYENNEHVIDNLYKYNTSFKRARNTINIGWCIPASCSAAILEKYLNKQFQKFENPFIEENVTYKAQIAPALCHSSNQVKRMDTLDYSFCAFTVLLVALVIIGTFCEYNYEFDASSKKSISLRLLFAFSARKNFLGLSRSDSSPNKVLDVFHGVKVFAICMIVMCHRSGFYASGTWYNYDYVERSYQNLYTPILTHGDLYVDTFFFISGLLLAYNLLGTYQKQFLNPALVIILRYLRLTPALAYVIFFTATLFYHTGNGALWEMIVGGEKDDCRSSWWSSLLYISNFRDSTHECLIHTWYVYCDFQYFLMGLFLVLLYYKNRILGMSTAAVLFFLSIATPFAIIVINRIPPFLRFLPDFLTNSKAHPEINFYVYRKSYTRAGPYLVGMAAGYIYFKLKGKELKLSKLSSYALASISCLLLISCVWTGSIYYDPYHDFSPVESAFYGSLQRPLWAIGTFGLVFSAGYGTLGAIRDAMSWKIMVPLGKLVYGVYLWHFVFDIRLAAIMTSTGNFSFFNLILEGLSDIFLAFVLSLLMHLVLEAPVNTIVKILVLPEKKKNVAHATKDEETITSSITIKPPEENSRL